MTSCKCGSMAINDDPDKKVCDVCLLKSELSNAQAESKELAEMVEAYKKENETLTLTKEQGEEIMLKMAETNKGLSESLLLATAKIRELMNQQLNRSKLKKIPKN